ncbi:MAG: metal ABC transporter substrate-binding protein [Fibrobacterota bacterium]
MAAVKQCMVLIFLCCAVQGLNIVTSIPDIADIAKQIGREKVSVYSLAEGTEDIHFVRARSSFLPILNNADLLMSLGLLAEQRWLPDLARSARNRDIHPDASGWVEVYNGIVILETPDEMADSLLGHHLKGNPHYNNSPHTGPHMARNIYAAMVNAAPELQEYFYQNLQGYLQRLEKMNERLRAYGEPLRGLKIISYHADLAYFCEFYDMEMYATIEPRPGQSPNARHLALLVEKAREDSVDLVLYHQAQNSRIPNLVARRIGAPAVCFANMVGSRPEITSFIRLNEYNLRLMLEAIEE